jgi:hypothetical protein
MLRKDVERLHPVKDRARARAEQISMFPKRIRLTDKVAGWRRSEVNALLCDPEAWALPLRGASIA